MPILYAELQIAGRQVACQVASFSFEQPTDDKGRPSDTVRIGLLKAVVVGEAAGWSIWEEIKFNPYRRESGHLVFFQNVGQTAKRYTFYDAALVWLQFGYDGKGTAGQQTATQVELHFSAATIELDGLRLDAHSLIPWETDPQANFRTLTKPPAPLPSAHLAAGMGVVNSRLAKAAVAVVKKALPIAGEGLAQALTLLPALLLTSVNADADPAKDADWQMYMRNHAQLRLAQLERLHEQGTLTPEEEAEMLALLAKVKGIHMQRLADLRNIVPDFRGVHLAGSRGEAAGEFDGINMTEKLFIEDKSAKGLDKLNPKTGLKAQTPEMWAKTHIFSKTVKRISALANAPYTYPSAGGPPDVPTIGQIREFHRLQFRVDADTPALRVAVENEIQNLKIKYPNWDFTAQYGY